MQHLHEPAGGAVGADGRARPVRAVPSHSLRTFLVASPTAQVVHQVSGIRGEVLPAFSVANGAVLEANFGGKTYAQGMPMGFQGIIKSMSLL